MSYHRMMWVWWVAGVLLGAGLCAAADGQRMVTTTSASRAASAPTVVITEREDALAAWRQWFAEHRDSVQIMPLPEWQPPKRAFSPEDEVAIHDPVTGETRVIRFSDYGLLPRDQVEGIATPPGGGRSREGSSLDSFGEPTMISDPSVYPWRVNCKLRISAYGHLYGGSGVLIDSKHVLTAGHCVFNRDSDTWVDQIEAVPGMDSTDWPYGSALSVSMMAWTGWTVYDDWNHDMGVVELDRPVGALTQWHGFAYSADDNFYLTNTFHNAGYPGLAPYNGIHMWYWYGTYDSTSPYIVYIYNTIPLGGMSGSGAYHISSGVRYVYTILSHGWSWYEGFIRVTDQKYTDIANYIASHRPATLDLVAMDCNVTPETVQAGMPLSSLDFLIHNYSDASWSGTANMDAYLSTNDIISTGDVFLGTTNVTNAWGPLSILRVNWSDPPATSPNTAADDYWIGVTIDHSDYNNGNNATSGDDAAPIHITACPTIGQASLVSPAPGSSICSGTSAQYCWHRLNNATTYRVQWDDNAGFSSPIEVTTSDTCVFRTLTGSGTWYWWVRGERPCRNGSWSSVRSVSLIPIPAVPTLLYPASGTQQFSGESLMYCWRSVSGATGYAIQWSQDINFNYAYQQNPSDTCITRVLTDVGTWYWRVAATTGNCFSSWTTTRTVIVVPFEPPDVVLWMQGSILRLAWSYVSGARTYEVQYADTPGGPFDSLTTTSDTSLVMSQAPLKRFFQVIAQHP
jgi:glutamyl endopeptidase